MTPERDATAPTDAEAAFARYEAVRARLPRAGGAPATRRAPSLAAVAEAADGFALDAFGVLNVGDTAIPGAAARMAELRAMGRRLCVLTNAASYTRAAARDKYRRMGFDFADDEIVSSRDVAAAHLEAAAPGASWAAICAEGDDFHDLPGDVRDLLGAPALWREAEAFLFLSSARWTPALQARLVAALAERPRPVVVANPDLVAPREDGLSLEPGWWAHALQDAGVAAPRFFGKPYGEAFAAAADRLGGRRLAMVGDTPHTDILGGRAAGFATVLVTDHGLLAGRDALACAARAGLAPDWAIPSP